MKYWHRAFPAPTLGVSGNLGCPSVVGLEEGSYDLGSIFGSVLLFLRLPCKAVSNTSDSLWGCRNAS